MPSPNQVFHAHCACGRVELEGTGVPMATLACYCDDCQAAAKQIDALPPGQNNQSGQTGHSGVRPDGGTVSVFFRKDRVRCVRGSELLVDHKLEPSSHTTRAVASCCNSNMSTRFDNWWPIVALRTYSVNVDTVHPQLCMSTKFAPDASQIPFEVPKHAGVAPGFAMKLMAASVQLTFKRLPLADQRLS
jgi:hypothetical protein